MKTTKELREAIKRADMTIETTGFKGRYKVISRNGLLCNIVRFSNAKYSKYNGKLICEATVNVLWFDCDNNERWRPMSIDEFLKNMHF